ncbi:fumarylacetoacetate hydrolase family protein [Streptomyces sp. NPDC002133]|uniref:fumarylacetoacetate hydrolase family protein n=1 Tax=Streptomyces sp. NPDC002133 TaxID=3154409 RepID=UPI00331BAE06
MTSPAKLAHVVLRTQHLAEMRDWYVTVLDGKVMHEDQASAFITYDDEHHRIALANMADLENPDRAASARTVGKRERPAPVTADTDIFQALAGPPTGLFHIAFTYDTLDELLGNYERLAAVEIWPVLAMNHGVTTSTYYRDPDVSATMPLAVGDVVLTGTPGGVALAVGGYLRSGDVVTVEIEGLGQLRNPVRTAPATPL